MVGDHAVLGAFIGMAPWLVPIPFFFLGLLVCTIQTFVFVLLSMIYIGLSVQDLHHGHDDDHGHGHHLAQDVTLNANVLRSRLLT